MGNSQVPRGATKKERCKCGFFFYPKLMGSSLKLTKECVTCNPEIYKEKKEK